MSLETYKKKRSFNQTPEPVGGKSSANELLFVIQKHAASRLHYDFRLEMAGVLKSWAVPKGPSMNPADKRLAMLVEDHPIDYKDFEGSIPEGNYGAGSVIIWDQGTYEPLEKAPTKAAKEKLLLKAFNSGSIKISLYGKKVRGEFALVLTKGRGENSWLLIKHRDEFATKDDVTEKDKSVVSGKRLEEVAIPEESIRISAAPGIQNTQKRSAKDIIIEAREAEKNEDLEQAASLYKQAIQVEPDNEVGYNRLMIIYRKLKDYKEELRVINNGIEFFEAQYANKAKELFDNRRKISQLSNALMKSVGLADKKGKNIYVPEPINKWKKRKEVVEKKVKK